VAAKLSLVDDAGQRLEVPSGRLLEHDFEVYSGHASVRNLHPGRWQLAARAADGRTWTGTAVIPPGGGEVEVELQKP
jgi:hypothetical protein